MPKSSIKSRKAQYHVSHALAYLNGLEHRIKTLQSLAPEDDAQETIWELKRFIQATRKLVGKLVYVEKDNA